MQISLYIKTHNVTKLKYFGKTTRNPHKYNGSGKYWLKHLKTHGIDLTTEVIAVFDNVAEATHYALVFSETNNIVESNDWANLIVENACDGKPLGCQGHNFTNEQRNQLSKINKERWCDPSYKEKMSKSQSKAWTPERKKAHAEKLRGRKRPDHSEFMKTTSRSPKWTMKGRKFSDDHKSKISASLKNHHSSLNK